MNKKSRIALGPGAPSLILIFVVLSMTVLGMLSLMSAGNDLSLSRRAAEVIEAVYRLNARAEETRAALRGFSPARPEAEVTEEEGRLVWQETDGTRRLDCAIDAGNGRWLQHRLSTVIADHAGEELTWFDEDTTWMPPGEDAGEEIIQDD
ncbi:MAG: hypothetical protein IKH77_07125 [Clostridia bacterium]|nr:hypothetical protein [Clostridia bacterium]